MRTTNLLAHFLKRSNEAAARMSAEAKRIRENQEAVQSDAVAQREAHATVSRGEPEERGAFPSRPAPQPLVLIKGGRFDE